MRATSRSRRVPKTSAITAVKYAPPAIPPRKKYQTISISQPGVLVMAVPLAPAAEREDRTQADGDRGADRQQRIDDHVALRQLGIRRQVVRGRPGQEQEERVQPAKEAVAVGAVELSLLETHALQRLDALLRLGDELIAEYEMHGHWRACRW